MDEIELQPLRITGSWNVEWNLFYEVDPSKETMHYLDSSSLLHLNNYSLMRAINLDFRPENDINGYFYLRVINLTKNVNSRTHKISFDADWDNLYFELKSKSRIKIVKEIERLVREIPPFKG
ncbi:hypothetical protein KO506_08490 [Polaribacter vadi]|uniref:hypothetical protein n=1 Tax=Polaribacter TaxID=52959 RepID=UPI001C08096D|nr:MULTISPECIES: hypothetical protein [Polaribacter]MBU3011438.1 hypothetical protein [Polaribacter vadi]MDO6741250.1 hypothetical protein [Polaribacter sp. 1_MG-2023]